MSYKVIGAMGDSITNGYWDEEGIGWFGRLGRKILKDFPKQYGFTNISQNGDRICDAFHRLGSDALTRDIDILIVAIGINDVIQRVSDPVTDMSLALRGEYWRSFLDLAQQNYKQILILDILPVREELYPVDDSSGAFFHKNNVSIEYNQLIKKLCQERNIPFFARYENWKNRNLADFYDDTAHPNTKGHEAIADEVYKELLKIGFVG